MPPRKPADETDSSEPVASDATVTTYCVSEADTVKRFITTYNIALENAVSALVLGDIIIYADGAITWRTGHLEHIANLYAGDPATTERNYADDLAVARAYSADVWEQLTNG